MARLAFIALLTCFALSPAQAWPPAIKGEYAPAPGSRAETWMLKQVLHKLRHKRAMLDELHWLKAQPEFKDEYADITDAEAAADSDTHDFTKLHQEKQFLREQDLPIRPVIPEIFSRYSEEGVRPAPEGSRPKDPRHPSSSELFRIWVDRLNASDEKIEARYRAVFTPAKREKLALLSLAADLADTGAMRGKEFNLVQKASTFAEAKISGHWERLNGLGRQLPLLLPLLKRFEVESRPGVILYQSLMQGLDEEQMLPRLRDDLCKGALLVPQGLNRVE